VAAFTIRIPDELRDQVRTAAENDRRSVNGQIEWMLWQQLGQRDGVPHPATLEKTA
jgi:hypothetical protein